MKNPPVDPRPHMAASDPRSMAAPCSRNTPMRLKDQALAGIWLEKDQPEK
jgi:hypothetical protein